MASKKEQKPDSVTGDDNPDEKVKQPVSELPGVVEQDKPIGTFDNPGKLKQNSGAAREAINSFQKAKAKGLSSSTNQKEDEEKKDENKQVNGVSGFTNPKQPGKVTTKLWRLKNESDDEALKRVKANDWKVEQPYHFGKTGIHYGTAEDCNECKRISKTTEKEAPDARFLEVNSLSELQTEWAKSPNGLNVIYMAYYVEDDPMHHMTLFYIPCGIGLAAAMYTFGKSVAAELPKLKAKLGPPDSELDLANRTALKIEVRLKGNFRSILDRLTIRKWRPHMTVMEEGKYKEGDIISMVPKVQIIRSDLSHVENANSYSKELGVSVSISDLKGEPPNVDKHKEKADSESESDTER